MKKYILIQFMSLLVYTGFSQVPTPVRPQATPILLKGATAHLGTGEIIENSAIGFDKGKITMVSTAAEAGNPAGYEIIDVTGKQIYPGFILPNSTIGLTEVSSIRAMRDFNETGSINPNVRSVISYNTDSEIIPTFRFNGILLAESTPQGGLIPGTSSVMEMEGWNWEDAVHSLDIGVHLNWPDKSRRQFDFNTFTVSFKPNENYAEEVAGLKKHFTDAMAYGKLSKPEKNLKMEAMQGLFSGKQRLFIHASQADEIIEAITFAENMGVKNITLLTAEEALHVAEFIKQHQIPVIIPPTHSLPARADEPVDRPYELPSLLTKAGLIVAFYHDDDLANARNLPFFAGTAVAYGMDKEEALKTITANAAKALGIDQRVGTLE
ncbi:MAG: amidohydrolase family protein, partial [Saprospiraceae bacterium]|nr:amidohydrolase family protein [Saprospiraceae bacterium]